MNFEGKINSKCTTFLIHIELLSRCFQIYDHDFFTQKLILLQCITAIISIGLTYAPMVLDLAKYIPQLSKIANEEHKTNAANEVYSIVYIFCQNVSLLWGGKSFIKWVNGIKFLVGCRLSLCNVWINRKCPCDNYQKFPESRRWDKSVNL